MILHRLICGKTLPGLAELGGPVIAGGDGSRASPSASLARRTYPGPYPAEPEEGTPRRISIPREAV